LEVTHLREATDRKEEQERIEGEKRKHFKRGERREKWRER
jgi:hypothetical protein